MVYVCRRILGEHVSAIIPIDLCIVCHTNAFSAHIDCTIIINTHIHTEGVAFQLWAHQMHRLT